MAAAGAIHRPLQVDPVSKSIGWKNGVIFASYGMATGLMKVATKYLPAAWFPGMANAALAASGVMGICNIFKSNNIHQAAERENPNRNRLMSWLTHPIKKMAFNIPISVLIALTLGQARSLEDMRNSYEQFHSVFLAANAIACLPTAANIYEVAKRSLQGLKECYQHATATAKEKIATAAAYIGNLSSEIAVLYLQINAASEQLKGFEDVFNVGAQSAKDEKDQLMQKLAESVETLKIATEKLAKDYKIDATGLVDLGNASAITNGSLQVNGSSLAAQ